MIKVAAVHKDEIDKYWPLVENHFMRVVERNPDYITIEAVYDRFKDGRYILIIVLDGKKIIMGMAAELVTCDTGNKILMIPHLGGDNMDKWLGDIVDSLYTLARDLGCFKTMISGARKGWIKVMEKHGGEFSHAVIEFDTEKHFKGVNHG